MSKKALKITRGSTFLETFRWETPKKLYKIITDVTNSAPVIITSVDHGLPEYWRGKISNVLGMTELNSSESYYELTKLTSDTIEINSVNSVGFKAYISGGILEIPEPVNLTGYSARMQVRADVDSDTVLLELTTDNSGIILDTVNSTIAISVAATDSADISWDSGVYSLELVSGSVVSVLLEGSVTILKEVTR